MMQSMKISMCGQKMEYSLSRHAFQRIGERSRVSSDEVFFQLAFLLEREDVGDYLLNEVRVGEEAVIIDEDNGTSYVIAMGADTVDVVTVHCHMLTKESWNVNRMRVAKDNFAVLIKNAKVAAASLFGDLMPALTLC